MLSTAPFNTAESEARRLATRADARRPVVDGVFRAVVAANGGPFSSDAEAVEGIDAYARTLSDRNAASPSWPGTNASVARQYALLYALTVLGVRGVRAGSSLTFGDFLQIPDSPYVLSLGQGHGIAVTDLDGMHFANLPNTDAFRPAMEAARAFLDWTAAHPAE